MTPDQENLCRQALNGMKTISLVGPLPHDSDGLTSVLRQHGLLTASINPIQGTATGFTAAGLGAIDALAKTFRPNLSQISRRASNSTIAKLIGSEMMKAWIGLEASSLTQPDFDGLQAAIDTWFGTLTHVREHLVVCTLFPYAIPGFTVGPVTFRHLSELPADGFGVSHEEFWPKEPPVWRQWFRDVWAAIRRKPVPRPEVGGFRFSELVRFASERAAPWVAFVKVTRRPPEESTRAADLSTDIALAAIQLISPGNDMRGISRASARAAPVWRADVSRVEGGGFSMGTRSQVPAVARPPELIEAHIDQVEPALRSMGQRLGAFLDASSPVPDLDEAWCNAAYWYHEALAETLDTVAVAKLETAIEVLFRAENMSGSKRRVNESFDVFFGLKRTDPLTPSTTMTVEQFSEAITTARSRVLHGTWPTLQFDLPANKSSQTVSYGDVELVARTLLVNFSIYLDDYIAAGSPADTTDAFFEWIKARRSTQSASATAAPTGL
ncbi:hypothetical protein [Methylobacterium sp. R2-1]|uniref:hypothetical protein n=1 Tax=Methylobacterium sp. R2-1 TaxID=2587064 RepID=UPI00161C31CF|nr:hypothetical protein [Methylobacterium sp. R2-1]MBB2959799.1 hypothetical protein [Methylobacterium sp. R2-1]